MALLSSEHGSMYIALQADEAKIVHEKLNQPNTGWVVKKLGLNHVIPVTEETKQDVIDWLGGISIIVIDGLAK